jgi:hypothetical protein
MKINLGPKNKIILGILITLALFIDWKLSIHIVKSTTMFLAILGIIFQFYLIIEITSNYSNEHFIIDTRSKDEILHEQEIERIQIIQAVRNNLLMKIAEGNMDSTKANKIMENVLEFETHNLQKKIGEYV